MKFNENLYNNSLLPWRQKEEQTVINSREREFLGGS